jgi:hypothetical protein
MCFKISRIGRSIISNKYVEVCNRFSFSHFEREQPLVQGDQITQFVKNSPKYSPRHNLSKLIDCRGKKWPKNLDHPRNLKAAQNK